MSGLEGLAQEDIDLINQIEKQDRIRKEARKNTLLIFKLYEALSFDTLQTITKVSIGEVDKFISETFKELSGDSSCPKDISSDLLLYLLSPEENWMNGLFTRFDEKHLSTKESSISFCTQYLEDREKIIKWLLPDYSLIEMKVIEDHIKELTKDMTLNISLFQTRYKCDCGTFIISHSPGGTDTRDIIKCCTKCGRSSATWKLVSGRTYSITKKIHNKIWGFINVTTEEKIDCGFDPSKHMQYDPKKLEYDSFFETKSVKKKEVIQG